MADGNADHQDCPEQLRRGMAPFDVTVSAAPPLVDGQFTTPAFVCPHGVPYWIEPTGEQLAAWAEANSA